MRFDWSLRGGSCYDGIFLVLAMGNLQKSGNSKRTFPLLFGYWWCRRFMLHFRLHRLDMLHGRIIIQPLHATNWMSVVQKLQSLCWYSFYATGETGYVLYSASVDADGHKRDPTSRHSVEPEIQRNCNFEAHVYQFSYRLGCMSSRWFILSSRLPYNLLVKL